MADLKLQPFELSLWKDKVFTEEPEYSTEEDLKYKNVYRGLGTDEKDLSFWFLSRKWNGAKFIPDEDDPINKVIVDIAPPQERTTSLVHADFSTSCLDFKPNTYYTFLLHLDFTVEGAKLPDWSTYIAKKANVNKDNHYLISFIRKKIESSMWHMPPSIFNSSVAISFDEGGFNLENSELNEDYEDMRLFIHKDSGVVDHVLLLCSVKTNDFLTENNTLGLWSFFEAWADDYWKAGMEIYGFEDRLISYIPDGQSSILVPESFKDLYLQITEEETYVPIENLEGIYLGGNTDDLPEVWKEIKENLNSIDGILLLEIKDKVNKVIREYYETLYEGMIKGYTEDSSEESSEKTIFLEKFQSVIGGESKIQFYNNSSEYSFNSIPINTYASQLSLQIAKIFYSYFPGLVFPYMEAPEGSDITNYYDGKNTYHNISNTGEDITNYLDFVKNFFNNGNNVFCITKNILLPVFWTVTQDEIPQNPSAALPGEEDEQENLVELQEELQEQEETTETFTSTSLYLCRDLSNNNVIRIADLTDNILENIIQTAINNFWNLIDRSNGDNLIEQYLKETYFSFSEINNCNNLYEYIMNINNQDMSGTITVNGIEILIRLGMTLSYFSKIKILISKTENLFLEGLYPPEASPWPAPNGFANTNWEKHLDRLKLCDSLFLIGLQTIRNDKRNSNEINNYNIKTYELRGILISFISDFTEDFFKGITNNPSTIYIYRECFYAFMGKIQETHINNNGSPEYFLYHLNNLFNITPPTLINNLYDKYNSILMNTISQKSGKQYIKECKQLVFGVQDGPPSFAQNIALTEGTKDNLHTLTFSLYNHYYNEYGKKEENYLIDLLHEEDKIKLKYGEKWYDFIITDTNKDNIEHKVDYTAKDANVIELSKIGFNKTFNTELDNNVGTINELATLALQNTNWKLDELKQEENKFYQGVLKPVVKGILKSGISIDLHSYYYDKNLIKIELEEPITLNEGNTIYVFIDDFKKDNDDGDKLSFKIICAEDFSSSFQIINNQLTNVCLYPNFSIFYQQDEIEEINTIPYFLSDLGIYITLPDIFQQNDLGDIDFDYTLRGEDIVTKPYTHYNSPLRRYVMEYKDKSNDDKILYGYVKSEYTTTPLIQNLLPNGEDFTSLDGWITGSINNAWKIDMNLGAAIRDNDMSTITPFFNFSTNVGWRDTQPHGFACNTELGYNFSAINHINCGDEFVLRVQLERGDNFDAPQGENPLKIDENLTLMETMRPYIYEYDNLLSLQSKNSPDVLPLQDKQVLTFIQDARYKERAEINCGLKKLRPNETNPYNTSTNRSVYDKYAYNLKDTMCAQGLVSIHWAGWGKNGDTLYCKRLNYLPCAYIQENLAKVWCSQGYLTPFRRILDESNELIYKGNIGEFKKLALTPKGWEEFRKLFVNVEVDGNIQLSAFNLRDFSIIANIPANKCEYSNYNRLGYRLSRSNIFPSNLDYGDNTGDPIESVYYYLPMLFTNSELKEEITDQSIVNNLSKKFFKYNDNMGNSWKTILQSKEYYELQHSDEERGWFGYPHNITIQSDNEDSVVEINYIDGTDREDFDIIMRMRAFWYLAKYSKTGTCIFETTGRFYGRPVKQEEQYVFRKSNQLEPNQYNREDLLTANIGLFFTYDDSLLEEAPSGSSIRAAISKIELFRKYTDAQNNLLLPNKFLESNTTPIYYLYDNDENLGATKEEEFQYEYVGAYVDPELYELNIDLSGEKKNSITITESNVYNILQKLAEIFDAYLVIEVNHNENGEILERENNENHELDKNIYFINNDYVDNFSGIKYGINLQKITRKIDSNDLITKLIVKNNGNEFGKNGFCSIARSKYNLSGSNAIFNLDYLITMGIITSELKEKLYQEIYPRTRAYGQFLEELIDHRAKQSVIASQSKAESDFNRLILNEAKEKMNQAIDSYNALSNVVIGVATDGTVRSPSIGYYIADKTARQKLPPDAQKIINTAIFYMNLVTGYNEKCKASILKAEDAERDYETSKDITESIIVQRDSLLNEFQLLAGGRIKEGAWSSEDYIDDDLYYLDGERQLRETSVPKVSYTIEIADISSLPGYEGYKFNLRDKTTIEDPEMFGYDSNGTPNKEEIIISEKTSYLQSPDKNTITVQNYKTKFEDLFQRMASTIKAVEFGTLNYTNKNSTNSIENRVESNETDLRAIKIYNNL